MSNYEIKFQSNDEVREAMVFSTIEKLKDSIVGNCKKCDNGFIRNSGTGNKVEDLIYSVSKMCSCYKQYKLYSSYLKSGIPKEFWKLKDEKIEVDKESNEKINFYLNKLDKVYEHGVGILFLGSSEGINKPNSGTGKTLAATKVLMKAIEQKRTAHYITMHHYFHLIYRSKQEEDYLKYVDEIEKVDFLCIDEVGKVAKTDYVYKKFEDVIRFRSSQLAPTILITNMNQEELSDFIGLSLIDIVKNSMISISIIGEKSYRSKRFINIKKELKLL